MLTETSEPNTVPTKSFITTEEILANDDKKISTAENPTENPEATPSNVHPPTEDQQLEITTSKDQYTQLSLLSTPQMSTISKELASSGMYQNIHFHCHFLKFELFFIAGRV